MDDVIFNLYLHASTKTIKNLSLVNKLFYNMSTDNYMWSTKLNEKNINKTLKEWIELYHYKKINELILDIQIPIMNIFNNELIYKSIIIDPNDLITCELSYILPEFYDNVDDKHKLHYFYITYYETKEWIFDIISSAPRYRAVINYHQLVEYFKIIYRNFEIDIRQSYNENIYLILS